MGRGGKISFSGQILKKEVGRRYIKLHNEAEKKKRRRKEVGMSRNQGKREREREKNTGDLEETREGRRKRKKSFTR